MTNRSSQDNEPETKILEIQSQIQALIFYTWFKYRTFNTSRVISADARPFPKAGVCKETGKKNPE